MNGSECSSSGGDVLDRSLLILELVPYAVMAPGIPVEEIESYLRTGDHDCLFLAWPGADAVERMELGTRTLQEALIAEVRRREGEAACSNEGHRLPVLDLAGFTRAKVSPMIQGLFPRREQGVVLELLERSVVFVTPENIETVLRQTGFLSTAWEVANIYLASIGAAPLGGRAWSVVGLSVDTTCYVSLEYFTEDDPFADYVVHEAAHVFHNTKRRMVGLRETRTRQWLLPIDYAKRETFAYACEAYSRLIELGKRPAESRALLGDLRDRGPPADERADPEEYFDILGEALERRNGWRVILERCSEGKLSRRGRLPKSSPGRRGVLG